MLSDTLIFHIIPQKRGHKMKKILKKSLAMTLAFVTALTLFAGCKPSEKGPAENPNDLTTQFVYVPEFFEFPAEISGINYSCLVGEKIIFTTNVPVWEDGTVATQQEIDAYYTEMNEFYRAYESRMVVSSVILPAVDSVPLETQAPVEESDEDVGHVSPTDIEPMPQFDQPGFTYEDRVYSMNLDGTGLERLKDYVPLKTDGGEYSSSYLQRLLVDGQGNLCTLENVTNIIFDLPADFNPETDDQWNYYVSETNGYYLRRLTDTGKEISSLLLNDVVDLQEGMYFYINYLTTDSAGNIYFTDGNEYQYVVSPNGDLLFKLQINGWVNGYVNSKDGSVAATLYPNEGDMELRAIDLAAKAWGETYSLPPNAYNFMPGNNEYDMFYSTSNSLFGYNAETGVETKIITWLNSNIDGNSLSLCHVKDEGDIFVVSNRYYDYAAANGGSSVELVNLVRKPVAEVPQKQVITFACHYLDYQLRAAILNFNRTNPTYRIEVNDYSEYATEDDYTAGITKLNTEIISGNVPDIISITDLPIKQYAAKGLLEDLYPFIDSDPKLSREQLMMPLFEAMAENGKLHSITYSFDIYSFIGHASVLGPDFGWTVTDLTEIVAANPRADYPLGTYVSRNTIFNNLLAYSMDSYVNWSTGECRFDTEDFRNLLEFAKTFPTDDELWGMREGSYDSVMPMAYVEHEYLDEEKLFAEGRILARSFYFSDIYNFQYNMAAMGDDFVVKGVPSQDGGGNVANTYAGLAMTSTSKNKEGAWEFMRTILTEDFQQNIWGMPTNKIVFDAKIAEAATQKYDQDGNPYPSGSYYSPDGNYTDFYALTPDQIGQIWDIINNIRYVSNYDQSLVKIITEDSASYFAGEKSVDEIVTLIQSRMSIYVNEQR